MNLAAQAPAWLIDIFFVLLLLAALEDGWRLRIANIFPIAIIGTALIAVVFVGLSLSLWQNALLFTVMLLVGTMLFSAGQLGGGDVKLLAACALWFDLSSGWKMLVAVALAGGVLAVVIISLRPVLRTTVESRWVVLRPKGGIPYGIAIAIGAAVMTTLLR